MVDFNIISKSMGKRQQRQALEEFISGLSISAETLGKIASKVRNVQYLAFARLDRSDVYERKQDRDAYETYKDKKQEAKTTHR